MKPMAYKKDKFYVVICYKDFSRIPLNNNVLKDQENKFAKIQSTYKQKLNKEGIFYFKLSYIFKNI